VHSWNAFYCPPALVCLVMMSFSKLFFGTAGIPISTPAPTTLSGINQVRSLGLDAMELEFVHSINLTEAKAKEVGAVAQQQKVILTCHGQYFINLHSAEKAKKEASIARILSAAKIADLAGAVSMTFHAGFYMGSSPKETFDDIKAQLELITKKLNSEKVGITIRPETTGKATQFGSLEELLSLCSAFDNCLPCIDFSHLHARSAGKINSLEEFRGVLEKSEKALGKEFLKNLHCHVSGIEYTAKGERRHLELEKSDFNYKALLMALKEFDCRGIVICESPNIEQDALLLKNTFESLK